MFGWLMRHELAVQVGAALAAAALVYLARRPGPPPVNLAGFWDGLRKGFRRPEPELGPITGIAEYGDGRTFGDFGDDF